ncbi:MAG: agmatinase [Proteobacteria bacterium]|nr:agmatinase [Pseudomonadota bacterium]MBU4296580.1 agmatinase [Pseudomonadota bacterium]MCG2748833.1 agmatinase [Desulfobulbaceae bacterium]
METLLHGTKNPYYPGLPAASPQSGRVNIIGACFDGTACFRKGARLGPDAIRRVAEDIETYSPYLDLDLTEVGPVYDLGNLPFGASGTAEADWLVAGEAFAGLTDSLDLAGQSVKFLALGGEHSVSYFFIRKYLLAYPDLLLLHLDAHADLRDGYEGYQYSHASVIRRCLDHFGPGHQLAQFGIRSGTRDEFAWMKEHKTLYSGLDEFCRFVEALPIDRPLYLTLDLDFFDPAFLPGTGTPEAGGEDFLSFIKIVKLLKTKKLVGADVVELAPAIDPTGNSEVFAAKVVRELILALHGEGTGHVG